MRQTPFLIASRGERGEYARPSRNMVPASGRSAPKMRRATSVRPAPDQAGKAEDFAAADGEGDAFDGGAAAEIGDDEAIFADADALLGEFVFEFAAYHHFDQLIRG